MISEIFKEAVNCLLIKAGMNNDFNLKPLTGGVNNRLFRIDINGRSFLLKSYFRNPDDPRDRLGTEFSFISFAWKVGIRCIPRPVASDKENGIALYEFIEGRRLTSSEITEKEVFQALNFYQDLNRHKFLASARALPIASEACFSISEHLQCVEKRLQTLKKIDSVTEIDKNALDFICNELLPTWDKTVNSIKERARELGLSLHDEIKWQDRCLSPSDFGFHNAILTSDGLLRFIDFEYAGWDDPAKTICDFFCQPAVPVPLSYYDKFVETVVSKLSEPEIQRQRAELLMPVYKIKWCCILLNEFLPSGHRRRGFALKTDNLEEPKREQLRKALSMLSTI